MADRGFITSDILDIKGVSLNIPPQKLTDQLTEDELIKTRRIANRRIHMWYIAGWQSEVRWGSNHEQLLQWPASLMEAIGGLQLLQE